MIEHSTSKVFRKVLPVLSHGSLRYHFLVPSPTFVSSDFPVSVPLNRVLTPTRTPHTLGRADLFGPPQWDSVLPRSEGPTGASVVVPRQHSARETWLSSSFGTTGVRTGVGVEIRGPYVVYNKIVSYKVKEMASTYEHVHSKVVRKGGLIEPISFQTTFPRKKKKNLF